MKLQIHLLSLKRQLFFLIQPSDWLSEKHVHTTLSLIQLVITKTETTTKQRQTEGHRTKKEQPRILESHFKDKNLELNVW